MSLVNTLKNLKSNLFGGPGNTGFSQPPPSKVQGIGMTGTPTSSLDSDPMRFGTYQFPKDIFENQQLGHYMVFYVNEQKRTKYDYSTQTTYQAGPQPWHNGTQIKSNDRRLDVKNNNAITNSQATPRKTIRKFKMINLLNQSKQLHQVMLLIHLNQTSQL